MFNIELLGRAYKVNMQGDDITIEPNVSGALAYVLDAYDKVSTGQYFTDPNLLIKALSDELGGDYQYEGVETEYDPNVIY